MSIDAKELAKWDSTLQKLHNSGKLSDEEKAALKYMRQWALMFENYEDFVEKGAFYPDHGTQSVKELTYLGLGLAGEAGETVDIIKKIFRNKLEHQDEVPQEQLDKLVDELGDVMWYITGLLMWLGVPMREIITHNTDKLTKRYPPKGG